MSAMATVFLSLWRKVSHAVTRRLTRPERRGNHLFRDLGRIVDLRTIRTVFDIGAHAGESAVTFHRQFSNADIYAFEPVEPTFGKLKRNTAGLGRVRSFCMAVGAAEGEGHINTYGTTQLCSLRYANGSDGRQPVHVTTLSAFAQAHEISRVDFLKIDVEGFELEVLEGARDMLLAAQVDLILIEGGIDEEVQRFTPLWRLCDVLRAHGYEVYGFYDQSTWDDRANLLYLNALFISGPLLAKLRSRRLPAPTGRPS